jgi:hypothetical protein
MFASQTVRQAWVWVRSLPLRTRGSSGSGHRMLNGLPMLVPAQLVLMPTTVTRPRRGSATDEWRTGFPRDRRQSVLRGIYNASSAMRSTFAGLPPYRRASPSTSSISLRHLGNSARPIVDGRQGSRGVSQHARRACTDLGTIAFDRSSRATFMTGAGRRAGGRSGPGAFRVGPVSGGLEPGPDRRNEISSRHRPVADDGFLRLSSLLATPNIGHWHGTSPASR